MPTKRAIKQNFFALWRQKKAGILLGRAICFPLSGVTEVVGTCLSPQCPSRALALASLRGVWPKAQVQASGSGHSCQQVAAGLRRDLRVYFP